MSNETLTSSFPATQQDISRLKQTAIDAATDLGGTASVHASKAKDQLKDLAVHAREEGYEQFNQAKGKFSNLVNLARERASERPFACIGAALAIGFLIGLTRRSGSRG
jgi:ElaB/YqjD/DUF883 family membrane-anchored ribosome-binding protein